MISQQQYLTFNDVLIKPQYSRFSSRQEIDISVELTKGIKLKIPFIPANMKSVIGPELIKEVYLAGGLSLLHRFAPINEQIQTLLAATKFGDNIFNYLGVSVGVKPEDRNNLAKFVDLGIQIVCIDIAHAHSKLGIEMTQYIAHTHPHLLLIVGNVATENGARDLFRAGADVVKVGIGASSICSTRLESGSGFSQLSAIIECHTARRNLQRELDRKLFLISDGGHSIPADCVKALCYTDLVMLGGMFSRVREAAGEVVVKDGVIYKKYAGSSTHKQDRIEGVKALVKSNGTAAGLIKRLSNGLQSGCSYTNAANLKELKEKVELVRISEASWQETKIHYIDGIDHEENL